MGRKGMGFCAALCFLGAFLAVTVSAWMGIQRCLEQRAAVATLELRMASMEEKAAQKHLNIAKWYNWSLEQGNFVPEWDYQNVLNLGEGEMGLLHIPAEKLSFPITHGIGGVAGHDPATSLPVGGRMSHTVLYIEKAVSWREGMEVWTILPGIRLQWQVQSIRVMPAGWPWDYPEEESLLTLVYDKGNTRTLIRCQPGMGSQREANHLERRVFFWGCMPFFLVPVFCGLGNTLFYIHPRKGKKDNYIRFL